MLLYTVVLNALTLCYNPQHYMMSLGYHVISTSLGHQKRTFDVPINAHQWKNSVSMFVCDNCSMVGCYGNNCLWIMYFCHS